ncbi:MAG: metalloregulator ArsR/SmtB family transcription factor [Bacteroidetes bacterium]|jgi:ArsR family transcriptional regulator|nr:metalloregulator ArsR/SmtB family transcription factor [Bacteroidota bacterium]
MPTKADQFAADLGALAAQAKALAHPARLAIIQLLADRDACVCGEIVDDLPLAQSTVSRHLKVLKEAGLVQGTVDGPSVCYCLDAEAIRVLHDRFADFFAQLEPRSTPDDCC